MNKIKIETHKYNSINKNNENKIKYLAVCYRQFKIKIKSKKQILFDTLNEEESIYSNFKEIDEDNIQFMNGYISYIDNLLKLLTPESFLIMKNDFFEKTNKKNWWIEYFTRSSYYRKKEEAMLEFLSYVN